VLSPKLRDLSLAGWLLTLLSAVAIAAVAIAVGAWALEALGRSALRRWTAWFVPLLALPGLGAGFVFWMAGARILHACGVPTTRAKTATAPRQLR